MKFLEKGETLATASAKAGMGQKTVRKWWRSCQPPSEPKELRSYRTRPDAFANVWSEVEELLDRDAVIEVETIFDQLCRQHPGKFRKGQLRSLQRNVKSGGRSRGSLAKFSFPNPRARPSGAK